MSNILLIASLAAGISVVSLILTIVGIVLHRREPPDVADVKARLMALDQEVTDVNDRLGQWMRREAVRKMRDGKADAPKPELVAGTDKKSDLRRKAMSLRNGS